MRLKSAGNCSSTNAAKSGVAFLSIMISSCSCGLYHLRKLGLRTEPPWTSATCEQFDRLSGERGTALNRSADGCACNLLPKCNIWERVRGKLAFSTRSDNSLPAWASDPGADPIASISQREGVDQEHLQNKWLFVDRHCSNDESRVETVCSDDMRSGGLLNKSESRARWFSCLAATTSCSSSARATTTLTGRTQFRNSTQSRWRCDLISDPI